MPPSPPPSGPAGDQPVERIGSPADGLPSAGTPVPPDAVPMLVFVMGMAGGLLSLFYLLARRFMPAPASVRPDSFIARALRVEFWRIRRGGPLPYACAIAAGGLFVLL